MLHQRGESVVDRFVARADDKPCKRAGLRRRPDRLNGRAQQTTIVCFLRIQSPREDIGGSNWKAAVDALEAFALDNPVLHTVDIPLRARPTAIRIALEVR